MYLLSSKRLIFLEYSKEGLKSIRDELAKLKESINKKESVENDNSDDNKVELEVSEKDDQ